MHKKIFLILTLLIIYVNSGNNTKQVYEEDESVYEEQEEEMFKKTVKDYLTKNLIYGNETVEVTPEEMRKIFKNVMTGDKGEEVPEKYVEPFEQLTTQFIDEQYNQKNRKTIKGSEVFGLFDINDLNKKFNAILEKLGIKEDIDEDDMSSDL